METRWYIVAASWDEKFFPVGTISRHVLPDTISIVSDGRLLRHQDYPTLGRVLQGAYMREGEAYTGTSFRTPDCSLMDEMGRMPARVVR